MGSDSIDLRQPTATPVRVRKLALNGLQEIGNH